jgi:ABC-2 type transport system ATP-binding protein/lipopolysaccharide transport system ATP-binding protein
MGMRPSEVRERVSEIAAFTELGDYLNMPVRTYSSGMVLRLAFAVATCVQPEILVMDEWMMAGDATFLNKARRRMETFVSQSSIMVLATHSEVLMREWCTKGIYLDKGEIKMIAPIDEVLEEYTKARKAAA